MPDEPEVAGLLALMLLHDSRREARTGDDGSLVTLDVQDRARWDRELIAEGKQLIDAALRRRQPGEFQVQAAIAALHAGAPTAEATDWPQIAELYSLLPQTPVVMVNRAVAVGFSEGPEAGLEILERVEGLDDYTPFQVAKAELEARRNALAQLEACFPTRSVHKTP
jgi:RNA polymerase sigma-70 factor (ECF subfamily)